MEREIEGEKNEKPGDDGGPIKIGLPRKSFVNQPGRQPDKPLRMEVGKDETGGQSQGQAVKERETLFNEQDQNGGIGDEKPGDGRPGSDGDAGKGAFAGLLGQEGVSPEGNGGKIGKNTKQVDAGTDKKGLDRFW